MAVYFQKREIVVPGQLLAEGRYRASVGSYGSGDKVFSAVIGLAELRGNTVKVVPLQGVYIPHEGDLVIGTITIVAGNNWKVDLRSGPYLASLHANNALRRPYDDDISRYMDIGDVIVAEVSAFDRVSGPFLHMKGRGLRKLEGGMLLRISPAKVPRVIGRRGSMINMIKDTLHIQTVVGQNGVIWIRSGNPNIMRLAVKAFKMIEAEAHTSKLTDRVHEMIRSELEKLKVTDYDETEDADYGESLDDEDSDIDDDLIEDSDIEPEEEDLDAELESMPEEEMETESDVEEIESAEEPEAKESKLDDTEEMTVEKADEEDEDIIEEKEVSEE
ncbi:MAG: exosome complex RNA-binding protein Rrp4 [Candidatus Thorarchaeota archaeon]